MLALPTTMESALVACSDVLVQNPQAWAAAVGPGWDTRLGFDEVQAVLLSTWETAAELLPDLVGHPAGLSWAAPPTTELRMTCEQPADNGVLLYHGLARRPGVARHERRRDQVADGRHGHRRGHGPGGAPEPAAGGAGAHGPASSGTSTRR